jgi:hypothetical protein
MILNHLLICIFENFEIIDGNSKHDIRFHYHERIHFSDSGTLGNSCMRQSERNNYMSFYDMNPETIKMVVSKAKTKTNSVGYKVSGRALLWKLKTLDGKPTDRFYMDRIYTNRDQDTELFKLYAKENGWLYKSEQGYDPTTPIVDTKDGSVRSRIMTVQVIKQNYRYFPYIDTIKFLDKNYILSNDQNLYERIYGIKKLNRTNGEYRMKNSDSFVRSRYHGERVNREYYQYCEIGDDYIHPDEAIYIRNRDVYATPDTEVINIKGRNYIKSDLCKLKSGEWTLKSNCNLVYTNREKTESYYEIKNKAARISRTDGSID